MSTSPTDLLALYWGPRVAKLDDAANLVSAAFSAMAGAGYSSFYRKGTAARSARRSPFEPTPEAVAAMLRRGVNRRDIGNEPIPELGRSFGLWSGHAEPLAYTFTGLVGNSTAIGKNNLLLQLPKQGDLSLPQNLLRIEVLFNELISVAQPDHAIVCASTAIRWSLSALSQGIPCHLRYDNA